MPGERQLLFHREDSHLYSVALFDSTASRKNKRRFWQPRLARQRLHLVVAQPARVSENREIIPRQPFSREHVNGGKPEGACPLIACFFPHRCSVRICIPS